MLKLIEQGECYPLSRLVESELEWLGRVLLFLCIFMPNFRTSKAASQISHCT